MRNALEAVLIAAATMIGASSASACSRSVVQPGSNTTDSLHVMKRGTSCSATFDLSSLQIHRISIVEGPRTGTVVIRGNNAYVYRAGNRPGPDEFTVEFDTTAFDWRSGQPTYRSTWRVKQPFMIE